MKFIFTFIFIICAYTMVAQPYWQQKVDTKIDVRLDDKKHFLYAFEDITYTNNSPDTLKFIYIHLWPNAYKNDRTPFAQQQDRNGHTTFYYSKPKDRGYIDSLQFTVNGYNAEHYITEDAPDIARLDLPEPLYPKHSIKISTPFKVKIPIVFSRLGHTGQAYFISQWFPKPAVYDHKGWHPISYLDQGEFFSDYGSYDVFITLPKNYVLLATGNCMDENENKWLDDKSKEPFPSDTLYKKSFPISSVETKTVHFHEDNVHDFAWFADKRWLVTKDSVVSPGSNEMVTTYSAFLPSYRKYWLKSNIYLKETVKHYGKWVGTYPYKTIKAVLGDMKAGGGMEYPTITVIDKNASKSIKTVVIHEAGHNWFYGILGSMERDHAWMDEGLNTFYERKTSKAVFYEIDSSKNKQNSLSLKLSKLNEEILFYELCATHGDMVIDQTSNNFLSINYGMDVYYKTSYMLNWLEKYMDSTSFEAGMREYFSTWKFKHPYPEDFKTCMQKNTTKNIDWFFTEGLNTSKAVDYKISNAKISGNKTDITLKNNTGFNAPVLVDAYYKDSIIGSAWSSQFNKKTTIQLPETTWTSLRIDKNIPDYKSSNNEYRRSAIFHNFGFGIKPFFGLNHSYSNKLEIAPIIGYNAFDGFMAGLLLHDFTLPENRFRFLLAPLYGFNSNSLVGAGSIGYQWYPENFFKEILLQTDAKTFNYANANPPISNKQYLTFLKVAPSINFTINEHNIQSTVSKTISLKCYSINEETSSPNSDTTKGTLKTQQKFYGLVSYNHANSRTYNPFSYYAEAQMGADFAKFNLEGNVRIDYNVNKKSLYVRAYLGKFFIINNDPSVYSRYMLNASYSGINDYLYDGTYFGRTSVNNNVAHQISIQEGGFKIPVFNSVARSDDWMATINLKTDIPKTKLPLRLFFDAGLIPNQTQGVNDISATTLLYEGGIEVFVINNVMSIYFPIIKSSTFDNYLTNTFGKSNAFGRGISFTFQLQNINWLKSPLKMFKLG